MTKIDDMRQKAQKRPQKGTGASDNARQPVVLRRPSDGPRNGHNIAIERQSSCLSGGFPVPVLQDSREDAVLRTLAAWLQSYRARSPQTAARYKREARAFLEFLAKFKGPIGNSLLQAAPSDCRAFVNLDRKLSNSTRAVKCAVLRSMFGALVVEGLVPTNPAAEVKVKRAASGEHHQAVPRSIVLQVLDGLGNSIKDTRDRALIVTMLSIGARRSEVANLKVGDIEHTGDKTYIRLKGKGGTVTRMLLRSGAVRILNNWLKAGGHGDGAEAPLFFNLSRRPDHKKRRSLSSAGVWHIIKERFGKYCPHGLRARAITDVWKNSDNNIHMAQIFARHSSPTVTEQVYVQAKKLDQAMKYAPNYE
ncbi:MAG: hypothetical protein E3J72_14335 [Planctomycetota bacterium]|nr:MAG: hypothetical protein E3J72_14335 [Planctomycetota bacterium]